MFFTTVGAARYFIELRMKGKYRDLMALVEFGDQAYVITPFTTDYENILFSMSLIGDWTEFMAFPDQGTVIANAIDQSVGLFRAFDLLDAAGNAMVIFTDGIDAEVTEDGKSAFDVLGEAQRANIPVYFIRDRRCERPGQAQCLRRSVDRRRRAHRRRVSTTRADEAAIVRAIQDIDRRAAGPHRDEALQHRAAAVRVVCARRGGAVVRGHCCCGSRCRGSRRFP